MKKKGIIIINTVLVPIGTIALTATSCNKIQNEADYWTDSQKQSIQSITNCAERLWSIDYQTDLKMDQVLESTQTEYSQGKCIHDAILPDSPYVLADTGKPMPTALLSTGGCTAFSMLHTNGDGNKENIVGKNYDWFTGNEFCAVIKNNATDVEHHSIGFATSLSVKLQNGFDMNIENKEYFLYSPWFVLEGMNDVGLTITTLLLHSGANHMNQTDPNKKVLASTFVPQVLLSNCATVSDCAKELFKYNLRSYGGLDEKDNSYQWLIADKENSMLITYINNEMITYSNLDAQKRADLPGGEAMNKTTRICNLQFQSLPVEEEDKNPSTHPEVWRYGSTLLPKTDAERITENTNYLVGTNFYVNILDSEMEDNPQPRFRHLFGQADEEELRTFFACQDNGFWRYCKCCDVLEQYGDIGPDTEQAMNVLKQCAYCLQDGDIRALRWKRKLPFKRREDWTGLTLFSLVFNTDKLTIDLCLYENYDNVIHFSL